MACLGLVEAGGEGKGAGLALGIGSRATSHMQVVVFKVNRRNLHQPYVAGDAAIVPPVEDLCGNILGMALVVHLDDDDVLTVDEQVADVEVEWCEAADMMTGLLAIHPHMTVVVDGAEVKQRAVVLHGYGLKASHKPYRAFIEEQPFVLRVPVGGYLHGGRLVEIVLYQVFRMLRLGISEEAPPRGFHAVVIVAFFLDIDDVVPVTIEQQALVSLHILQQRHLRLCLRQGQKSKKVKQ